MFCLSRPTYQHKIIGYVAAPLSCLPLAMNQEFPIPWKHILPSWEYALLKNYLCIASRFKMEWDGDLALMIRRNQPLLWSVCCHDQHENTLQALARRVVVTQLLKELVSGFEYNLKFPFYRKIVNKNLSFRILYEGSLVFRGKHLIFVKINYWGDISRIRKLKFSNAVICRGFTGVYLVLFCDSCSNMAEYSARLCAANTRVKLVLVAHNCDTFSLEASEYEKRKQNDIQRLTYKPCVCL